MSSNDAIPLDDAGRKGLKPGDVVRAKGYPDRRLTVSHGPFQTDGGPWRIALRESSRPYVLLNTVTHLVSSRGPLADIEPGEAEQPESIYAQAGHDKASETRELKVRLNLPNMLRQAIEWMEEAGDELGQEVEAKSHTCVLQMLMEHAAGVRAGKHSLADFAEFYCLTEAK